MVKSQDEAGSENYVANQKSPSDNPKEEAEKIIFDDIIIAAGEFGRYQRRIYLLLCLPLLSSSLHTMVSVFLAAQPEFRCLLPNEDSENATYELSPNITNISDLHPWKNETNDWPKCERYDVDPQDDFDNFYGNISHDIPTVKCESFVYDTTTYELTTATEFDLVCDSSWLRATADSLFMLGVMIGAITHGALSDIYGRRRILCLILWIQTIIGFLVALSPEIYTYLVLRFLLATTTNSLYLVCYVTAVEMVVPSKRLIVGAGIAIFYSTGYVLTTVFAYFITNWRFLQIAVTLPNLAYLIYWWLIPESARWSVMTGRKEEARDCIQKASMVNGIELSKDRLDHMLNACSSGCENGEKATVLDLFRYPNLRRKSLLLFFTWFTNSFTYFGLSWSTSSLVGNVYINFAISGIVEIPAHLFVCFTLNRWGRKKILCTNMMVAGSSLLVTLFIPKDVSWLTVVFTMLGKMAITASYGSTYVFTTEQYPTVVRNVGIGACSMCARIGGILAPYVNYSSMIWTPSPIIVYGVCSLIGGLAASFLPETMGKKLPESIEDGEQQGKSSKSNFIELN